MLGLFETPAWAELEEVRHRSRLEEEGDRNVKENARHSYLVLNYTETHHQSPAGIDTVAHCVRHEARHMIQQSRIRTCTWKSEEGMNGT